MCDRGCVRPGGGRGRGPDLGPLRVCFPRPFDDVFDDDLARFDCPLGALTLIVTFGAESFFGRRPVRRFPLLFPPGMISRIRSGVEKDAADFHRSGHFLLFRPVNPCRTTGHQVANPAPVRDLQLLCGMQKVQASADPPFLQRVAQRRRAKRARLNNAQANGPRHAG